MSNVIGTTRRAQRQQRVKYGIVVSNFNFNLNLNINKRAHNLLSEHGRGGGRSPLAMLVGACAGCMVAILTHDEGFERSEW
jgi:6,7-dimethyl-8-ribityllumazine synthase